jgi:hypothetical protein
LLRGPPTSRRPLQRLIDLVQAAIGRAEPDPIALSDADDVEIYDAVTQSYRSVTTLYPGQGAWAYSTAEGTLTLTPAGG